MEEEEEKGEEGRQFPALNKLAAMATDCHVIAVVMH